MTQVSQTAVPEFALLKTYRAPIDPTSWDHFQDCFVTEIPAQIGLTQYLEAFYGSVPFRLERWLIGRLIGRHSTGADVRALAVGAAMRFSAWEVLARSDTQILLGDFQHRTRSWLAVAPLADGRTRLHFGSGIRARLDPRAGRPGKSLGFRLLGGFHVLYSRILLRAAARALRGAAAPGPNRGVGQG